jgi:glycosyltransferase involved in cell wall biosynthesis
MTIIIPAYNCSKTLGRTLDSLVQQTNKEFSVVIIDDCSTENILDIINSYEK